MPDRKRRRVSVTDSTPPVDVPISIPSIPSTSTLPTTPISPIISNTETTTGSPHSNNSNTGRSQTSKSDLPSLLRSISSSYSMNHNNINNANNNNSFNHFETDSNSNNNNNNITSLQNTLGVGSIVKKGDSISVEHYRDVVVLSIHYDDTVVCRGISLSKFFPPSSFDFLVPFSLAANSDLVNYQTLIDRGDMKVWLKISLSASASASLSFKIETALLETIHEAGVHNVSKILALEVGRLGSMIVVQDQGYRLLREIYLPSDRSAAPYWTDTNSLVLALDYAIKLVKLVSTVHDLSIVHGSLRPSTVSVDIFNDLHLHDFSTAFRMGNSADVDHTPARERGMTEDSLPYLAPESSGRVSKTADYRSDYYGIGALLYEIFTGKTVFHETLDPSDLLHAHMAKAPKLANELDSSIPIVLAQVLNKLLEKSPEDRYQTSQGLISDLESISEFLRKKSEKSKKLSLARGRSNSEVGNNFGGVEGEEGDQEEEMNICGEPDQNEMLNFKVGSIDDSAHFKLPPNSMLFGRNESLINLLSAYSRVQKNQKLEIAIISGPAGIGKTSLVETLRKPVVNSEGYYTFVKFDQIKSPVPFFSICQALTGLFRQLISESEPQLIVWRKRLSTALGKEGRILFEVIPTLENVFKNGWAKSLPPVVQLGPTESEERFQGIVRRVLRSFARPGSPLVIFFDDLQWSTTSDISFIFSLISKDSNSCSGDSMLLLCAHRDVPSDHILYSNLLDRLDSEVSLQIQLKPLILVDVMAFVSQSFKNPFIPSSSSSTNVNNPVKEDANLRGLSELILQRTAGSPLFVAQLLKALYAEGLFTFDFSINRWYWDLDLIASKSVSTDVVELLQIQMKRFSNTTLEVLKVAACIGNEELSAEILAKGSSRTVKQLALDLNEALDSGLIVLSWGNRNGTGAGGDKDIEPEENAMILEIEEDEDAQKSGKSYRFFHDRCQQAAYGLIPLEERSALHYSIGQRLVAATPSELIYDNIFDLANQLNHGIEILTSVEEKNELARYNYLAGNKAIKSTAFEAARKYLSIAWDLLGEGSWELQYDLKSSVTEALVEVEFSLADYASAQEYVRIFLSHSTDLVGKLRIYVRSIQCATATGGANSQALAIGREGLAMVGYTIPDETEVADAMANEIRLELNLDSVEAIGRLSDLPKLTDPVASGALKIMGCLVAPLYFSRIDLLNNLAAHAVRTTVQYGIDDAGAFLLTLYGVLVAGYFQKHAESYAFGMVAIRYFEKYGGSPLACQAYKVMASHISVWTMSIRDTLPTFYKSVSYGIEYRDAEYLGFASAELSAYSLFAGMPLGDLARNLERYSILVRKFRNELSTLYISVVHQMALSLTGRSAHPGEVEGEAFSLTDYRLASEKNYAIILHLYHTFRLMLALFFHDKVRAKESATAGRASIHGAQGILYPAFFQLFEAVTFFDNFDQMSEIDQQTLAATFKLFDGLATIQPSNFGHMRTFLAAEAARARGLVSEAVVLYDSAINASTEAKFIHLSAWYNERCAELLQKPKLAAGYLIEAMSLWKEWGCLTLVNKMALQHPLLFPSLVPKTLPNVTSNLTVTTPTSFTPPEQPVLEIITAENRWTKADLDRRKSSVASGSGRQSASGLESPLRVISSSSLELPHRSQLATELDLRTVVQAASVLNNEINVDGAVAKLLALTMKTAGATYALLVLCKGGTLCAEAIATSDSNEVRKLGAKDAIDASPDKYPRSVIHYVARSRVVVVNNLDVLGEAISDQYLKAHKPKSILCLPLASQSKFIGVLYMENSHATNAFTPSRLEIVTLVSGQAASTIEKARLVQDLKLANAELQTSELALKEYNLRLEATVKERTNDLMKARDVAETSTQTKSQFLANMSHEIRTPFNAVVALAGLLLDTPLSPLQNDYVETIKNSSHELLVVINDILDFSKIELDHLELTSEKVSLRLAIESSLDMVAERAAAKAVELALVLTVGDVDLVTDLTRLRQIIVNLLSNAVKFTNSGEIVVTASAELLPCQVGEEQLLQIRVAVKDSGIGMAEKDFSKLFLVYSQVDGAETTKQFGGTGLGLAISRKLAKLMQGDITVESSLGVGSTFTLEFIAPLAPSPEINVYSPARNPEFKDKRCLIVDANDISRSVLIQLVSSFGFDVVAPDDVGLAYQVCVDACEDKPFDVVILDAFLPSFGAGTLLRRLRGKGIMIPAIALTRMASPITLYEELRSLDTKSLIKPVKRNRLLHILKQVFPSSAELKRLTPTEKFPVLNTGGKKPLVILAAEDNPVNTKVIIALLLKLGYTCDNAEDGLIALDKVNKKRYDLILMDVNMPNLNGLNCTRRIIEMFPDPTKRPYIAMTANALSFHKQACLDAGLDGYISKPILIPALVAALGDAHVKAQRDRYLVAPVTGGGTKSPGFKEENPFFQFNIVEPTGLLAKRRKEILPDSLSPTPTPPLTPGALPPAALAEVVIATPRLQ